mmetsp:Transcript_8045/g.23667  ORF Transcript_8045/g.23667 Transcript_8045/m.23667 type:complete len:201 (-) Transcript_8045:7-609(-)
MLWASTASLWRLPFSCSSSCSELVNSSLQTAHHRFSANARCSTSSSRCFRPARCSCMSCSLFTRTLQTLQNRSAGCTDAAFCARLSSLILRLRSLRAALSSALSGVLGGLWSNVVMWAKGDASSASATWTQSSWPGSCSISSSSRSSAAMRSSSALSVRATTSAFTFFFPMPQKQPTYRSSAVHPSVAFTSKEKPPPSAP